jgi:adenylate kinase family enzyme
VVAPVLVVAGPSGAGKTTVGRLVAAAFDPSAHVQIDELMRFVVSSPSTSSSPLSPAASW